MRRNATQPNSPGELLDVLARDRVTKRHPFVLDEFAPGDLAELELHRGPDIDRYNHGDQQDQDDGAEAKYPRYDVSEFVLGR